MIDMILFWLIGVATGSLFVIILNAHLSRRKEKKEIKRLFDDTSK